MKPYYFFSALVFLSSCVITPTEIPVSSVSLNQSTAEMYIGETVQLMVSISPSNATDQSVIWGSSKQSVATVDNTGLITATSEGNSTVTATVGGKSANCQVTVSKMTIDVSSISLNKTMLELVEGESATLTATVLPDDATDKTVTWSSSSPDIASVDGGKVNAIKPGEASITAKAGDKTVSCKIVISKKYIEVESVNLNKNQLSIEKGDSETLVANVSPDDATDKTVTWTSSEEAVATVDEKGKVVAVAKGSTTITAEAGGKNAKCIVTVTYDDPNNIKFADSKLKTKLVEAFDKDGDGELSYAEAHAINNASELKTAFNNETSFNSFDEFQYFSGIKEILGSMFEGWTVSSIILPNTIVEIGQGAFSRCKKLERIVIPEGVRTLGRVSFHNCTSLTDVST